MILTGYGFKKEISNNNDTTYCLITNVMKNTSWVDIAKLTIKTLHMEDDAILTNAYDIFGNRLHDQLGFYVRNELTEGNPYFYDKVRNAMLDFANIFKANGIMDDMTSKKAQGI